MYIFCKEIVARMLIGFGPSYNPLKYIDKHGQYLQTFLPTAC